MCGAAFSLFNKGIDMKKKASTNYSGVVICDSITMSVKRKRPDLRRIESVFIALIGFVSVIMSFLEMFDFNYNRNSVIKAAVIFSVLYILFAFIGRKTLLIVCSSLVVQAGYAYHYYPAIVKGFKYVYNVIYSSSLHTQIKYYKFLKPEDEKYNVTIFFIFCIWLLASIIYIFTIRRPNPVIVVAFTFPIIEIGLYNGIKIPVFWGILTVAYWLALLAICNIDLGEYYGGGGGFVRKDNLFFPKRQMRLKVTEKCAVIIIMTVAAVTAATLAVMKITGYQRSESLNQKRIDVKEAISSFTFDDLASSISAVTESFGFTFSYESHKLGNLDHIKYKNTTDLVVTFDKKYEGAVYLKGYAGAIYGDNEWLDLNKNVYKGADGIFDDFDEYGIYPQDLPGIIFDEAFSENSDITIWLEAKRKKNKSYAPYGTKNYDDMDYNHDTAVSSKKNGSSDYSYKFTGIDAWNAAMLLGEKSHDLYSASEVTDSGWQEKINDYCTENELFSYDDHFAVDSELNEEYISRQNMYDNGQLMMACILESRYRNFVYENYLQLPDNGDIDEIRNKFADILDLSPQTATEKLELLQQLRDRVNSMTEYSLSPGKTPSNRDFVNYFLLENHKGYCTHYASAGVLLARMAGIPARYATGYIVVGDDFNDNARNNDGTYTIELPDNRSHAWTEVYLDGFGWVPFEFTAGYSSNNINTDTTMTQTETTAQNTEFASSTTHTSTANPNGSSSSRRTSRTDTETTVVSSTVTASGKSAAAARSENDGFGSAGITAIISVLTAISVILLIYLRRYIIIRMRTKRFTSGAVPKRIAYMYEYNEKLLAVLKIKRNSMQYTEFAAFAEGKLAPEYFPPGAFSEFMNAALESSFGSSSPDIQTAEAALRFTTAFGSAVYEKSGTITKAYMKFINVLI